MSSLLQGSAIITGAASGIGLEVALAFGKHGITNLALADINGEALNEAAATVQSKFPRVTVMTLTMDVRNSEEVKNGIAQVVAKFGRLDTAVNNAGIGGLEPRTHEMGDEFWHNMLDTNLSGVYRCQKEELAVMMGQEDLGVRRGRGCIINVASMYGIIAARSPVNQTAYTTAKHGVMGLTKADANTYAEFNIRINAVCPGYVETPLISCHLRTTPNSPLLARVAQTPMRRMAMTEEVADSIVFLASPMSSFMQGAGVVVDGGFTSN
ncbi:enoyl-(Acyl carrier protein) reductase [Hirsutella rhossiliensis]|uniref:Enoyl-(Acyl carrier protein) reductase domain-containing protein n=1 Tax=Hirsutella rhossiliensis TaxID=111463 RepID=A0A9P8N6Q5_9HYPO|nr:enoyl-(Acyl carrier protein) reductase domain-containing protein [Hirsutella rhossiliensis]KAH0967764.1 enoyl-(Acyl carrier protein) reductase domain-containing protein [Hirsutella rhossiliensis]